MYHDDAERIAPEGTPRPSVKGMEAFANKAMQWAGMIEEYHGNEVSEPLVAGNFFSLRTMTDNTMKRMGRVQFEELIMYEVQDGKKVKEQFFYTPTRKP